VEPLVGGTLDGVVVVAGAAAFGAGARVGLRVVVSLAEVAAGAEGVELEAGSPGSHLGYPAFLSASRTWSKARRSASASKLNSAYSARRRSISANSSRSHLPTKPLDGFRFASAFSRSSFSRFFAIGLARSEFCLGIGCGVEDADDFAGAAALVTVERGVPAVVAFGEPVGGWAAAPVAAGEHGRVGVPLVWLEQRGLRAQHE